MHPWKQHCRAAPAGACCPGKGHCRQCWGLWLDMLGGLPSSSPWRPHSTHRVASLVLGQKPRSRSLRQDVWWGPGLVLALRPGVAEKGFWLPPPERRAARHFLHPWGHVCRWNRQLPSWQGPSPCLLAPSSLPPCLPPSLSPPSPFYFSLSSSFLLFNIINVIHASLSGVSSKLTPVTWITWDLCPCTVGQGTPCSLTFHCRTPPPVCHREFQSQSILHKSQVRCMINCIVTYAFLKSLLSKFL